MALLWLPVGLILPAIGGWLTLAMIEGSHPVLQRAERWVMGGYLGLTVAMFLTFVLHETLGVSLSLLGFGITQVGWIALIYVWSRGRKVLTLPPPLAPSFDPPRWAKWLLGILLAWTAFKIGILTIDLLTTPTFFDDSIDNWNLRGKLFFMTKEMTLLLPFEESATGISSYPPTVSLAKAWLASIPGAWHEGLINSIHAVWYFATLAMVYFALRRSLSITWSLLGVYMMGSIPLYLMHGTNAYAEVFLSGHIFAAVSMLFLALRSENHVHRMTFFRLAAVTAALLPFIKNEGLAIYLPVLLLVTGISIIALYRQKVLSVADIRNIFLWYAGSLILFCLPWLIFKWVNDLTFGNAKSLTQLAIAWQPRVLYSVTVTTFFEGNWILLFPLFLGLVAFRARTLWKNVLMVPVAFCLLAYALQLFAFTFTPLSIEALMQTGSGRGLIHLLPVVVFATTILLQQSLNRFIHSR